MKKWTILLFFFAFASSLFASEKTFLRIPIADEDGKSLTRFNEILKKNNIPQLPEYIQLYSKTDLSEAYSKISEILDKIYDLTNESVVWGGSTVTDYVGVCFKGSASTIVKIIKNDGANFFTEMLQVKAMKFQGKKTFYDGNEEFENDFPTRWKQGPALKDSILLIVDTSDDGDRYYPEEIPACK